MTLNSARWFYGSVNSMNGIEPGGLAIGKGINGNWWNTVYFKYCIILDSCNFIGSITNVNSNKIINKYK